MDDLIERLERESGSLPEGVTLFTKFRELAQSVNGRTLITHYAAGLPGSYEWVRENEKHQAEVERLRQKPFLSTV